MPYILSAFSDEAAADFREQMRICADNSIKWIEMRGVNGKNVSELSIKEVKDIKKQMDEQGFRVSSIGSPYGKINIEEDFGQHFEKFKRSVEAAFILGTNKMRIFSFYNTPFDTVIKRLTLFLDNAGGIQLCHENEANIYGESARNCKELYDIFGGRLKLVFDPANFVIAGEDIGTAYELLKDGVEYFHIKDYSLEQKLIVPSGYGDGKIEWLINNNDVSERNVFLSVEPHIKCFNTAVLALKTILCANGFTQSKDMEYGYGVWQK